MKTRNELKQTRIALGLTQQELAKKAQIGLSTVIKWEKGGNVRPSSEKTIREAILKSLTENPLEMLP